MVQTVLNPKNGTTKDNRYLYAAIGIVIIFIVAMALSALTGSASGTVFGRLSVIFLVAFWFMFALIAILFSGPPFITIPLIVITALLIVMFVKLKRKKDVPKKTKPRPRKRT